MDWYAVNTKPREELLAQMNLQRLGVDAFLPRLKQQKVIRRRWQTVIGPLFPGYIFARFNIDTHFRAVNYARGVRRVVTFGSVPAAVDEAIIEAIQSQLHEGYVILRPTSLKPGQVVRIHDGPFQGLQAVFERELSDQQRVVLLLQTLSYQARVVVDLKHVVNL